MESHGIIIASEFAEFLGPDAEQMDMFTFLTNLYDSKDHWAYHTITRGWEKVDYAYVVMLAASTPEQLQGIISPRAIRGGFGARLIIVPGEVERCIPEPEVSEDAMALRQNLIADLNAISELRGEFAVDEKAREWFKRWYTEERNVFHASPMMASWVARKGTTLKKLAMINSVAIDDELRITLEDYDCASRMLNQIEGQRESLLEAAVMTDTGKNSALVRSTLSKARDWMSRSDLLRKVQYRIGGRELREILSDLVDAGIIDCEVRRSGKAGGRRATFYRYRSHRSIMGPRSGEQQ